MAPALKWAEPGVRTGSGANGVAKLSNFIDDPQMSTQPTEQTFRIIAMVAVVMLIVALFEMPYGYYTFLRLAVMTAALLGAFHAFKMINAPFWVVTMGLVALLFNPVIPVHLTRDIWAIIDVAVASVFLGYLFILRRQPR